MESSFGNSSFPLKKAFVRVNGRPILYYSLKIFIDSSEINEIIIVVAEDDVNNAMEVVRSFGDISENKTVKITVGGLSRQESVKNGLDELSKLSDVVCIHDAARIFLKERHLSFLLSHISSKTQAVIPALKLTDTIKEVEGEYIRKTVDRERLVAVQTPQVFKTSLILSAYGELSDDELKFSTDDSSIVEQYGYSVKYVVGEKENFKITTADDLERAEEILVEKEINEVRVGNGFDTHRLTEGRSLILGGEKIPFDKGLLGHSDADVLTHAIMDAILGAAALGDIGTHFPDTDNEYKDACSIKLLEKIGELIKNHYKISSIDAILVAENPKISPYIDKMRYNISEALKISIERISIKATTTEGLFSSGRGEGMSAIGTATLQKKGV